MEWLKHFTKHSKCSPQHPVLLLMDNHASHVSISVIEEAKSRGIVLLTFPPHTSHKLQPLARNHWMVSNPGRTITIYEIGGLLGTRFHKAFTPSNIISGFRVSGVFPFNADIFSDDEFLGSEVTNRPAPNMDSTNTPSDMMTMSATEFSIDAPSTSTSHVIATSKPVTPIEIRPFPKAAPRKNNTKRRKIKSLILTNTPVKEKIMEELESRKIQRELN